MSEITKYHAPCPCGKSSDAYSEWADGHGYCFSCSKYFETPSESETNERGDYERREGNPTILRNRTPREFHTEYLDYRGFNLGTLRKYGVKSRIDDSGSQFGVEYPYGEGIKVRTLPKSFHQEGNCKDHGLFGRSCFEVGSAKAITITEGEDDCLAAYEMLGSKYPVCSIQSSATAKRDISNAFSFVNSFEKVVLCFDNDEAGQNAAKKVANLFDYKKVFNVVLNKHKDPQLYHENGDIDEFKQAWWGARKFVPEGILSSNEDIFAALNEQGLEAIASYPFPTLQQMSYGIRQSEVILVTADSGVGKTEFIRALEHHLVKSTDLNIGIIHLEEEKERCIKGLIGYELQKPIHLPGHDVETDLVKSSWLDFVRHDNRVNIYSRFGSDDPDEILSNVRFMASSAECKLIFLDHITMLVTGLESDDERRKLDYISTKLGQLARELDFTLVMVSHVNSEGGTHGSKNIHRVCDIRIHLERDMFHEQQAQRNLTRLTVLKNRFGSKVGPAGELRFNPETFVLTENEDHYEVPPV